jgi:plastocyanin
MNSKRISLFLAVAVAGVLASAAVAAAATPKHASVLIRHQTRGCHAWSVDGSAFKASQSIALRRGATLALTNNDVMPHTFVLVSGPKVRIAHATLRHIGASLQVTLTRPGTYHFSTKAGEDYPSAGEPKTIGEDNVLKLTVVVS